MTLLPGALATSTVTIRHPVMAYDAGALVADWTQPPTDVVVDGCSWQPQPGAGDLSHRDGQLTRGSLFLPPGSLIGPLDHVVADDQGDLAVVGIPEQWVGVLIPHTVARLERWTG